MNLNGILVKYLEKTSQGLCYLDDVKSLDRIVKHRFKLLLSLYVRGGFVSVMENGDLSI